MNQDNFTAHPRADTESVSSNHNQWALHKLALEHETLPPSLVNYHPQANRDPGQGYYDDYVPVAYDCPRGKIIRKEIDWNTIHCPDCEEAARDVDGEKLCPECGLICSQAGPTVEIVRDAKAAGRINE